jgi:hypothetical protein
MPFDDSPKDFTPKVGLKKPQGQASMFDKKGPKPPTQQDLDQKVEQIQEQVSEYKRRASDLFVKFQKAMTDTTLVQNRNILATDAEREMLGGLIQLAADINADPLEQECMGSLTLITCLFKTVLAQRDKINELAYNLDQLQKKSNPDIIISRVTKELQAALDKQKENG